MTKNHDLPQLLCLNCNAAVEDSYCQNCGQKVRDISDRSIGQLVGEVLGNIFFLDNRFLLSIWYLVRHPARMTVEFLEGKRKKFISPVTLFLFVNLIYFFVSPLSDYSISLEDQLYWQPYSGWFNELVTVKLQQGGIDESAYSRIYQTTSDNLSKTIMIINIPMIAALVYPMSFKRRRFYYDSLIFVFHFFSLFLASWIMIDWADVLIAQVVGHNNSIVSEVTGVLFLLVIPLLYAILSVKRFLGLKWYWAIAAGIFVMVSVVLANTLYRLIIFLLTVWAT